MTDVVVQQGGTEVVVGAPQVTKVTVRQANTVVAEVGAPVQPKVVVEQPIAVSVQQAPASPQVVQQGLQGPAGPPGPAGGEAIERLALAALSGHRIVRSIDATQVDYASSDQPAHGDDTLGITEGAAVAGAPINVRTSGAITFAGWAWTPGEEVYLGANGLLTQTAPETGFVQVVGFAESPTTLFVGVQPAIYLD